MADDPARRLVPPAQVAEVLGITVDEVIELVHQGRLRGARVGAPARWRIEHHSVAEYLDAQVEEARRMALWRQSNEASFPELWGSRA
ncbi:helix-turn-helix domain-containing protein [Microbacterium stercoris]|uniref:Helix-turn-helix domain-containing protein n=1 Tax=Microbacterium stercoris TaxID=2820289 RepID=A0A939TLF1_9MICO|nr:helix-turn-helix domain-containing protein [Microbacterium stercoris]MBO3662068.1 helix-turn-helix domain-containing protein [Microbacterium stercoris]